MCLTLNVRIVPAFTVCPAKGSVLIPILILTTLVMLLSLQAAELAQLSSQMGHASKKAMEMRWEDEHGLVKEERKFADFLLREGSGAFATDNKLQAKEAFTEDEQKRIFSICYPEANPLKNKPEISLVESLEKMDLYAISMGRLESRCFILGLKGREPEMCCLSQRKKCDTVIETN